MNGFIQGHRRSSMTVRCWNEGFPSGVDSALSPHPRGLSLPKLVVAGVAPDSPFKSFLFALKSPVEHSSDLLFVHQECCSLGRRASAGS